MSYLKERRAFYFVKIIKNAFKILIFIILVMLILSVIAYFFISRNIDYSADEELFSAAKNTSVTHFYANAESGGEYIPVEIETTAFGKEKKVWYSYDDVSDYLKAGFIAAEDREFYSHKGVNFRRTLSAFFNYVFKRGERFGASTITQQVVKNISGDNEVSAKRKINEIFRAMKIEKNHTKEVILELYMNIAPMSENIAGVGFASDRYFGKEPSELTLAEAAAIVGITNSPVRYDPRTSPERCTERRNVVLRAMFDMGFISKEELEEAVNSELVLTEKKSEGKSSSWFVETALSDVIKDLAGKYKISEAAARLKLMKGGYNIYTTENPAVQAALEEVFEDVENLPKELSSGLNMSMCICNSKTGDLVGIIGSAGEKSGNRILNLAQVPHPPGSVLKPLALYAPLLDQKRINWASVFDDVPVEFYENGEDYTAYPKNSPAVYDGLTTVKDALRVSKNTVAVRLYEMLGAREVFDSLKNNFGFDTLVESAQGASGTVSDLGSSPLALGQLSYGVDLRKLTEAYTVFPREGLHSRGRAYLFVSDKDGKTVLENRESAKRIFVPSAARIMNQLLMNVVANGTAKSITLKDTVDTAGKTGTTSDSRDKLFVGYTPYYTAGIWCGYPSSNTSVSGISPTHLEIWDKVMNKVHESIDCEEHFSTAGLVKRSYCKDSGALPDAACALDPRGGRIEEGWFTPDNLPEEYCTRHVICKYNTETEKIVPDWYTGDNVVIISLPDIPRRDFPKELDVTDEKYSYGKHTQMLCREFFPSLPPEERKEE